MVHHLSMSSLEILEKKYGTNVFGLTVSQLPLQGGNTVNGIFRNDTGVCIIILTVLGASCRAEKVWWACPKRADI